MITTDTSDNTSIVKSNYLVEARYDLSILEQKLMLMAISKINTGNMKGNKVPIHIKEFLDMIGKSGKRYTEIRNILRNLRKREIIITRYGNDKEIEEEIISGWINTVHYKKNDGVVYLEFPNDLLPYLCDLKERYTTYKMINVVHLSGKYAIRIYELLKSHEFKKSVVFEFDRLREILCCEDKFERYFDFKKNVLLPAQEEIKEKCDIHFSFIEIRNGKSLTSIRFDIEKNIHDNDNEQKHLTFSFDKNEGQAIYETYKQKSAQELAIELQALMKSKFKRSLEVDDLIKYSQQALMLVIFNIWDGQYKDIRNPVQYFTKVLNNEDNIE